MDQGEFAIGAGLKRNTYNQYEKGEREPDIIQCIEICEAYQLTLDWIYRGEPSGLDARLYLKIKAVLDAEKFGR